MFLVLCFSTAILAHLSHAQGIGVNNKIFYFAYGSNLLAKRIHINNPSAVLYDSAKLEKYRLDFDGYLEVWQGAIATIVPDDQEHVWGTLWTIDADQIKNLDIQEGVPQGLYFAKNVTATTPDGSEILARTYQETITPNKSPNYPDLPFKRRPSNTYLEVIALGAIESHLPSDYVGFVFSFPTNRKMAQQKRRDELGYPF